MCIVHFMNQSGMIQIKVCACAYVINMCWCVVVIEEVCRAKHVAGDCSNYFVSVSRRVSFCMYVLSVSELLLIHILVDGQLTQLRLAF